MSYCLVIEVLVLVCKAQKDTEKQGECHDSLSIRYEIHFDNRVKVFQERDP